MDTKALHYIAEFWGVDFSLLDDMSYCEEVIREAISKANCCILNMSKHKFDPQGLTIVTTLSESHCTIHTWPEHGYCAIDLYGCGKQANLKAGMDHFVEKFNPSEKQITKLHRGTREQH